MSTMTLATLLALLHTLLAAGAVGAVMPLVVAAIVRAHWPSWSKAAVALLTSLIVGTLTAWLTGQLTGLGWPVAIVAALIASQTAYRQWWHATGIAQWVESNILAGAVKVIEGEVTAVSTTPAAPPEQVAVPAGTP